MKAIYWTQYKSKISSTRWGRPCTWWKRNKNCVELGERCVTSQKNWSVYLLPFLLKRSESSFVTDRKRPLIMSVSFLFCGFISHLIGGCKIEMSKSNQSVHGFSIECLTSMGSRNSFAGTFYFLRIINQINSLANWS